MRHVIVTFAAAATMLTALYACSSDSSSSSSSSSGGKADSGADGASSSSSGGSSSSSGGSSSSSGGSSSSSGGSSSGDGGSSVNGCTTFVDKTDGAADRSLVFDFDIATNPDRCMKVKVGQDVSWTGVSSFHPLAPSGGTTPSPIQATTTDATVTFTAAGTFGYVCSNHASMTGAIQVVP